MSLRKEVRKRAAVFLVFFVFTNSLVQAQEVFSSFIILNGQPIDNPVWVEYFSDNEGKSLVHTFEITEYLKEIFSIKIYKKIYEKLDGDGKISFTDLNSLGIETNMDLQSLNLGLTVSIKDKKLTEVQLSNQKKKKDIIGLYKREPFSGYINVRSSLELQGDNLSGTGSDRFNESTSLQLEPVFNLFGLVFESQYIRSTDEAAGTAETRRAFTRLVYDHEKNSVRYTLGDLVQSTRGFQDTGFGLGFNIQKEFTITPGLFRSSFKKHKFFLDTDAKVEIFVNNKLIKKLYLKQGPVELSDFPFLSGENEVQVRVTDVFGNIKNINYSDLNDSRILPKGFSDYSFNVFFPRREDDTLGVSLGDSTYNYSDYHLTGYFQYGAFKDGVLGVDWQYTKDKYLFGVEALYGEEDGIGKLNLAQSENKELNLNGFALRAEYENLLFKNGSLSDFRLLTGLEYRTKGFTTLNSEAAELTEYRATVSVGQNFKNSIRASLGFSKEWGFDQDIDRTYLTSNFGWTFFKNFDFSANIRYNMDNTDDSTVLFALNWYSKSNNQQSTSTYDPVNETVSTEFVSFPIENRQNFRTYVGGEVNDTSKRATVGLDYFNQRAEIRLAHSSAFLNGDGRNQTTQLSLGSGIAFTTKGFTLTKPVDNAFVLVSMPDRPRGHSVPIGKGVDSQRGEISWLGPASVTNLSPYFTDHINLDIGSLPYGYILKKENYSFFPSYRSGIHITVDVEGEVSLNASAAFKGGKAASYITGNVYAKTEDGERGELLSQFFTGGDGGFSVERLEKKSYILVFESDEQEYRDISISINKSIGVHELEDVLILNPK